MEESSPSWVNAIFYWKIATFRFSFWVRSTSQKKLNDLPLILSSRFFSFDESEAKSFRSLVGGPFISWGSERPSNKGSLWISLCSSGFSRTAQAPVLFVLWQSQTGSRPLKVFPSQSTHALENCHITIRCVVHPDFSIGSKQSQVESVDHWWTEQPRYLAENQCHEQALRM